MDDQGLQPLQLAPFHGQLARQEIVAQIEVLEVFEVAQRRTQSAVHLQPGEVEGDHVQLIVADDPRPQAVGGTIPRCPSIQSVVRVVFDFGLELQEHIGLPGTVATHWTLMALEMKFTHAHAHLIAHARTKDTSDRCRIVHFSIR